MSNPFTYANKVRKKFKDPYWVAKNKYITYYEQLPIDEKVILLESQTATKISGNLFYILKYLLTDEKYVLFEKFELSIFSKDLFKRQ